MCLLRVAVVTAQQADAPFAVIDTIIVVGNEKTKSYVLEKQMVVHAGDTLYLAEADSLMQRCRNNIFNTGLFLSATANYFINTQGTAQVIVTVEERWFLFPKPWIDIADRNINYWWFEQNHSLNRLEYGLDLIHYNLTGHGDRLNFRTVLGFTQKLEVLYERPFLSPTSETGGGFYAMYARNRQMYINTVNNEQLFFETGPFLRDRIKAGVFVRHRQGPYRLHIGQLRYNETAISDTVAVLNPLYLGGGETRQQFFSVFYSFIDDKVDNRSYPLDGHFLRVDLQKRGLGIFDDVDQYYVGAQFNRYHAFNAKWYGAWMLNGRMNIAKEYPYFLAENLGYCENFVRGYEYYVMDGQAVGLLRTNLRFKAVDFVAESPLFSNTSFGTVPIQAYLKVFADAGYVSDNTFTATNDLNNTLLYSAGVGLDVTSYYDWVFRFEGAVNALGEFGLYLHIGLDLNTYENCSLW